MAHQLVFCVVIGIVLGLTSAVDVITSPGVTDWGEWADEFEQCPEGLAAQGFAVLAERVVILDKTGMNGLRLYCGNPADGSTPSVTSKIGSWGRWGSKFRCEQQGYMTKFQLRVERPGIVRDESATNNIRFWCTTNDSQWIDGDGETEGLWGDVVSCPSGQVICGIKTQVEPDRGNLIDDTALNNIAFQCCPIPI